MIAQWGYVAYRGQIGLVTMDLGGGCVRLRRSPAPKGQVREATIRVDQLREATDAEKARAIQAGLTREAERSRLPAK